MSDHVIAALCTWRRGDVAVTDGGERVVLLRKQLRASGVGYNWIVRLLDPRPNVAEDKVQFSVYAGNLQCGEHE